MYATRASPLGWAHIPGAQLTYARQEFRTRITYNRLGLRDRDYPLQKPAHTRRLLCLGDSFTVGMEVPHDLVWTEQIEQRLNTPGAGAPAVEVINAGVPGYGLDQMNLFLRREGRALQPDLVIVLHMGFFGRELGHQLARLVDGQLELREAQFTRTQQALRRVLSWWRFHSHVVAALCESTKGLPGVARVYEAAHFWGRTRLVAQQALGAFEAAPAALTPELALTYALLDDLRRLVVAEGGQLLLVLGDEQAAPLKAYCRAMGAACLALPFAPARYPLDGHWNAEGHAAVAQALAPWIQDWLSVDFLQPAS
jgi:lysophospholipase L1-like esterase